VVPAMVRAPWLCSLRSLTLAERACVQVACAWGAGGVRIGRSVARGYGAGREAGERALLVLHVSHAATALGSALLHGVLARAAHWGSA